MNKKNGKQNKTISFKDVVNEIIGYHLDKTGYDAILKEYRRIHTMMCELTGVPTKPIYEKDKEELKAILETLYNRLNSEEGSSIKAKIRAYIKAKEQETVTLKAYFTYDEYEQLLSFFGEAYSKLDNQHVYKQNIEQLTNENEIDQRIIGIMQSDAELRWSITNVELSVQLAAEYEALLLELPQFKEWRKKAYDLIVVDSFTNYLKQELDKKE